MKPGCKPGAEAMRTLGETQWQQYFDALGQLHALPAHARRAALPGLCGGAVDHEVAALVEAHLEMKPDVDRCRSGERIRNLLLHERIGRGGMGCVYRATQSFCDGVGREVAVKLIHPAQLLRDAGDAQRRFRAEIGALACLEHEGIARIYDGGIDQCPDSGEQTYYLAMELVRGQPLTDHVARHEAANQEGGPASTAAGRRTDAPARAIVRLLLRVCSAVAHAHRRGIVHGDLKPANILVDERGEPRLVDFGLASRCREAAVAGGTPAYASPEQLAGAPAAPAMDVYALGVILHELLLGRHPRARRSGVTPARPGTPLDAALVGVVAKACAADAQRRWSTVAELVGALSRCAESADRAWVDA